MRRNGELVREIKYLKSITKDAVDRYSLKVYACLVNIVRILESPNRKRQMVKKPNDKTIREMLSCIRSLRVKPKKGRAKDLVRIEAVAKKLDGLMPSQP
jgi:hypothetical protein